MSKGFPGFAGTHVSEGEEQLLGEHANALGIESRFTGKGRLWSHGAQSIANPGCGGQINGGNGV